MADGQSVVRVLQDIERLVRQRREIEAQVSTLIRTKLAHSDAPAPEVTHERVSMPYSMLHFLVSEYEFLKHSQQAEERQNGGLVMQVMEEHHPSRDISVESISVAAFPLQPVELESLVSLFEPLPKKHISDGESARMEVNKFMSDFDRLEMLEGLPKTAIKPLLGGDAVSTLKGPAHSSAPIQRFGTHACCRTISTYPWKEGYPTREGDPVCDRYFVKLYENRVIAALADGCNWGNRARTAAKKAAKTFVTFMATRQKKDGLLTPDAVAKSMLSAFQEAHIRIVQNAGEALWEAGTTTMVGAMITELTSGKWLFMCCNLGDCKALRYSKAEGTLTDLTKGTRHVPMNSRDPGGRLGPYKGDGRADLRNLAVFTSTCEEGDIIVLVSDGVYDCLDPRHQGKRPRDCGLEEEEWSDVPDEVAGRINDDLVEKAMLSVVQEHVGVDNPIGVQDFCAALTQYSYKLTASTRQFMVSHPNERLPKDYQTFPGKVDHTSVVAIEVGKVTLSYQEWMGRT